MFYFCTYLTNICKTELFRPRNPYDTDLPVIEDARELSYFSFFVFLVFGARRVDFFLLVVGGCWNSYSRCLGGYIHVDQVKLLPTYPMYIYSPIERWFNITPPPKKLSSASIIIIIIKKQRTPESGGISKLNLEQSFSYIKLFLYCSNVP